MYSRTFLGSVRNDLCRRRHRLRLVVGTIDQARWLIREPPYALGQTPSCRRGKTGGRSTLDRIIRHLGYARQAKDYAGLRAELAMLVDDFSPVIDELWPRLHPWHHPELNDHWTEMFNSDLAGGLPRA
jgi:hypothetical protein